MTLLTPAIGTGNIGDHFIEMAIRRLLGDGLEYVRISTRKPLTDGEIEAINSSSCALICGTNLYQRSWAASLSTDELSRIHVPVIPFGVGSSAGDLHETKVGRGSRRMIRELHRACAVGSVRDPHSASVVRRARVRNYLLTGCPVLLWSGEPELPAVEPVKRDRVVITARNWLMHREPHTIDHPVQIEYLRTVLDALDDVEVVFAIHEDFDRRLVDALGIPSESVFDSDDPNAYVELYSDKRSVVLANRLHAGMLALANGVPAVFVGHDTRTYSFCDLVGLPYHELFDPASPQESVENLRRVLAGDVAQFASVARRYPELRAAMYRFIDANGIPRTAPGAQASTLAA